MSEPPSNASAAARPPARPPAWQEALGMRLFLALAPRVARRDLPAPPSQLEPFERVEIERRRGRGTLSGNWFPAERPARGAVLLVHPWVPWGSGYFHRRGRIQTLRENGYAALALDLPGFGASGPAAGFFDRDVADALVWLRDRTAGGPVHLWGVSAGGYWAHPALAADGGVASAIFEDVAAHLLEWSWRTAPWGRPFYLFFRLAIPRAYRFLDLRRHAPCLTSIPVAYVGGDRDQGVPAAETRRLAELAGAECRIVEGAGHLHSIKLAEDRIHALALETLARGAAAGSRRPGS